MGPKRTCPGALQMSAFGGKADIALTRRQRVRAVSVLWMHSPSLLRSVDAALRRRGRVESRSARRLFYEHLEADGTLLDRLYFGSMVLGPTRQSR